jgi:hypothetical protein
VTRPPSPKTEPEGAPSDEALSRIAREAVHQPADPRLDRQLARLGVMDVPETADAASRRTPSAPAATAADVARLEAKLGRTQSILWLVVVAVGIVVVLEVIQLLR